MTTKTFEIWEGDGNMGECFRGNIQAPNSYDALRLASRTRMILKPKCVRIADIESDDETAYLADYCHTIYGGACAWTASAHIVNQ